MPCLEAAGPPFIFKVFVCKLYGLKIEEAKEAWGILAHLASSEPFGILAAQFITCTLDV